MPRLKTDEILLWYFAGEIHFVFWCDQKSPCQAGTVRASALYISLICAQRQASEITRALRRRRDFAHDRDSLRVFAMS